MPKDPTEFDVEVIDARDVVMAVFIRQREDKSLYVEVKGMRLSKRQAAHALNAMAVKLMEKAKAEEAEKNA